MKTGISKEIAARNTSDMTAPQRCEVRWSRRTLATNTIMAMQPIITPTISPLNQSPSHPVKSWVARPYLCSRRKSVYTESGKVISEVSRIY